MAVALLVSLFFAILSLGFFRILPIEVIAVWCCIYMSDAKGLQFLAVSFASESAFPASDSRMISSETEQENSAKARLSEAMRTRSSAYISTLNRQKRSNAIVENLQTCMSMVDSPKKLDCLNRHLPPELPAENKSPQSAGEEPDLPSFDVQRLCSYPTNYAVNECIRLEQEAYEAFKVDWADLTRGNQQQLLLQCKNMHPGSYRTADGLATLILRRQQYEQQMRQPAHVFHR